MGIWWKSPDKEMVVGVVNKSEGKSEGCEWEKSCYVTWCLELEGHIVGKKLPYMRDILLFFFVYLFTLTNMQTFPLEGIKYIIACFKIPAIILRIFFYRQVGTYNLIIRVFISTYEGKVRTSSLAYNRCETRDKRPLGRDPDRSWSHLHTSVKLFLVTAYSSMDINDSIGVYYRSVHGPMCFVQKSFTLVWRWHQFLSDSLPTAACPEFHVG